MAVQWVLQANRALRQQSCPTSSISGTLLGFDHVVRTPTPGRATSTSSTLLAVVGTDLAVWDGTVVVAALGSGRGRWSL